MWNRRVAITVAAILVMSFSLPASAIQPIKVLLARTSGVTNSDAREMLEQINNLLDNSDLGALGGFESASMSLGVPEVFETNCGSSDLLTLTQCAQTNLSNLRNEKNADIVLLMVSQDIANDCGGVPPEMINAFTVSQLNEGLAFAVIERNCFNEQFNNQVVASHEVGHLLAIEHVDGDQAENLPALADANHAYENIFNNATAVASPGDCFPNCTWHNFFSDKDKDFSSTPLDEAGNASDSNAVDVVSGLSWNVVASYRPLQSPPSTASCNYPYFLGCHQPGCAAWMLTFSANNATSYRIESRNLDVGPWIEEAVTSGPNYVAHRSRLPVRWRIQGVNSAGGGDWCYFWTTGECEVDDDPPNPYN